jgi:hypothetical protein
MLVGPVECSRYTTAAVRPLMRRRGPRGGRSARLPSYRPSCQPPLVLEPRPAPSSTVDCTIWSSGRRFEGEGMEDLPWRDTDRRLAAVDRELPTIS